MFLIPNIMPAIIAIIEMVAILHFDHGQMLLTIKT